MIKLLSHIDVQPLIDEYRQLEKDIQWTDYGHKGKQTSLQNKTDDDPWTSAVGKNRGKELDYTNLNPFFKDTIFEEIINKYKLLKTRLMWIGPYACYSVHKDDTPRIHVPIITNLECYFVFKQGLISHLPAGSVYWVDTTKLHTFMNCSDTPRLHIVGIVEK
jgi:hypothetical protein